jgi:uncharacterized cupin superfamily protein
MPEKSEAPRVLVRASERGPDHTSTHPYNPAAEAHGWLLSRMAGLRRIAVNLVSLPPGKEANVFHRHHREEEWLYVLEGRGVVDVEDGRHEISAGDFLGFPPGTGHLTRNAGDANLLYLEGGEAIADVDVVDFPRLGRRLARFGARFAVYPDDAELPFLPGGNELPSEVAALLGIATRGAAPRVLVRATERPEGRVFRHPENPGAEVLLTPLSRPVGLSRVAVVHSRAEAGKDTFAYHLHVHDEEWMFVVSGRAVAEIDDREVEIGPGDFLGFPPGVAHNVRASSELVYLQGGDAWSRGTVEIVELPRLGLRKTFAGTRILTFPLDAALERRGGH